LNCARLHPDLKKLEAVVVQLGVDGMSSDETDNEVDGSHILSIKAKKWRNENLTKWLHDLDTVHLARCVTTSGTIKKGNWPHRRRSVATKFSDGPPVRALPKSFYDESFLASLTGKQYEDLKITNQSYDLTHTPTLLE
jgi:hypothetical protein